MWLGGMSGNVLQRIGLYETTGFRQRVPSSHCWTRGMSLAVTPSPPRAGFKLLRRRECRCREGVSTGNQVTTRRRYGDRAELVARRAGVRAHSLRQQLTRRTIPLPARPREYLDPLLPRLCHLSRLFYAFTAGITSPSAAIPSATWLRNGALNPSDAIVISSPAAYFHLRVE